MSSSAAPLPNPESNPESSTPTPPVPQPKGKRQRSLFNKRQIAEMNKAGLIAVQALKPAHINQLAEQGKGPAFINALVAKILSAGTKGTGAVSSDAEGKSATVSAKAAKKTLLMRLGQIQSKAKLAFQYDNPERLRAYLVGQRIGASRALLEQSAQTILEKANEDRPGGINTDFITAGQVERTTYKGTKTSQRDKKAQARAERIARNDFIKSIQRDRVELQLAADAAWPAGVPANAAVRVLFYLQPNRAYSA